MEYSYQVRERFEHPSNVGRLPVAADVISASAGSLEQGVKFWLYARVARGRIEELKYRVYGCPHSIAAVSLASEQLVHLDLENLDRWHWRQVAEKLDVPAEKRGRLLTLEDAVRGLARAWRAHP
jgi:NifU-like protein involved in Fe-S cluster formation